MKGLEKATLEATNGTLAGDPIEVLFNPKEYTRERSNQFQANALPGLDLPVTQFVNGSADTLSMELFFDTKTYYDSDPVTDWTDRVVALTEIDSELHAPPVVAFRWGGGISFQAIIERISQRFTLFREDGVPVRAVLSVTFKQYETVTDQLERLGLNSSDVTRRHRVVEGDSYWALAHEFYEDPERWRVIAEANDVDDALVALVGIELALPPTRSAR